MHYDEKDIVNHLMQDDILKYIINSTKLPPLQPSGDLFTALNRSVIAQQLSNNVAKVIFGRYINYFDNARLLPESVLSTDDAALRGIGLSAQKIKYLKELASFFANEEIRVNSWDSLEDEKILEMLTSIKGIGTWTVQMILIFHLERPDILPIGDLVIKNCIQKMYNLHSSGRQLEKELVERTLHWSPYRSFASRYLWAGKEMILNS
jgi:DNA-3-methyladenine glycosylase II